jgi:peptide/nickel transport system ATP-binding protein
MRRAHVEIGPVKDVIHRPAHPHPRPDGVVPATSARDVAQIDGSARLTAIPTGCAFHPRCPEVFERCRQQRPTLAAVGTTSAACWLHQR